MFSDVHQTPAGLAQTEEDHRPDQIQKQLHAEQGQCRPDGLLVPHLPDQPPGYTHAEIE